MESNSNLERVDSESFSCPSCGGKMHFNIETQALTCIYCSSEAELKKETSTIMEYDFSQAEETARKDWGGDLNKTIRCESCGAESVFDSHVMASFCSFCGSSQIIALNDDHSRIVPESLIPFKVPKEKASDLFKRWLKRRWFAPNKLKENIANNNLNGTYLPYWTYDTNTASDYIANKGTHYYVTQTRTVNGKSQTVRVRKTRWTRVSGTYTHFFDDYLVHGSKHIDQSLIAKIEPFDLKELVQYKPEYLSGFQAERYSINLQDGWEIAKGSIDSHIEQGIKRQVNGDVVNILSLDTTYSNIKYKHFLLPVWLSSYKFKETIYNFLINGQTGEVQGKYPKSVWKISIAVISVLVIVGASYFFTR